MASSVASSMDCELLRTNNVVEFFSSIFQRADSAELKGSSTKVPEFDHMELCKSSSICPNCNGIRYSVYDNRTILMLPQPTKTGKSYAYTSDAPRMVKDDEKLETNLTEIQKGLRYAILGSGIDDFEESKKVLFTPSFHTRLQYFGNDPALVTDLWKSSSSTRFECNLQGPPPKNSVPALIGKTESEIGETAKQSQSSRQKVFWTAAAESRTTGDLTSQASAIAYRLSGENLEQMGAVTMTATWNICGGLG
ncbi:unnamed protein product [Durusdinium trenchii]|uniref:Uncharacterized protein n=1 Tax=Durusdinium trenchii TaxID=1381693 RepID=A0ABP0MFD3_9DINO